MKDKEDVIKDLKRRQRNAIRYILQPTLIEKGRLFHGIFLNTWA